jgi:hypothetical protein
MDDDFEKGEELYLMRFVRDPVRGLRLEDATRRELEYQLEEYCGLVLADQLMHHQLRKWVAQLQDFDDGVKVHCLVERGCAEILSDYFRVVDHYFYTPYGHGASGFGYASEETVAWLIPQEQAPAIFWRHNKPEDEGNVMAWIDMFQVHLENGFDLEELDYPQATEESRELVVPEIYSDPKYFRRFSIKSYRTRRVT